MADVQRDFLGQKRPHPMYVDDESRKDFRVPTWAAMAVVLALLGAIVVLGHAARRDSGMQPATPAERAVSPERIVPPQGQTGEVPGSRSPVQR